MCICAILEAIFEMYVCKVTFRHGNVSELHNNSLGRRICWHVGNGQQELRGECGRSEFKKSIHQYHISTGVVKHVLDKFLVASLQS